MILPNKTQWDRPGQRGFSLIEVILVLLVLSVIAGITIPNFSHSFNKFQLKSVTNDLAYLMRYAQTRSITMNKHLQLEFDADLSRYWLTQQEEPEALFERFAGRLGKTFKIPADIKLQIEDETVSFYPDGGIERREIDVCKNEACFTISTRIQRDFVRVFESTLN